MYHRHASMVALIGLVACATAGTEDHGPDAPPPDAAPPDAWRPAPDAAMTPDAMPPESGCQEVEVLANPGFDSGPDMGWSEQSPTRVVRPAGQLAVGVHGGSHAAWLGGGNSMNAALYQDVYIPSAAREVELTGVRWIDTREGSDRVYDTVVITLRSPAGATVETLVTWSNLDAAPGWQSFSLAPRTSLAGQNVRLHMQARTDGSRPTSFYLDTLSFRATVCR